VTTLTEHDGDGGKLDEAPVVGQELVVTGCDTPLLQLVEERLDRVGLPVEGLVIAAWCLVVGPGL